MDDEQRYIEEREAEAYEAWKVARLEEDPDADVDQETYADEWVSLAESLYDL